MASEQIVFFVGNKHGNLDDFNKAAKRLEHFKLGRLKQVLRNEVVSSKKKSTCFEKIIFEDLDESDRLEHINNLLKFQVEPNHNKGALKKKIQVI